jgi:hypothetical protein
VACYCEASGSMKRKGNFLTNVATVSVSRRPALHGISKGLKWRPFYILSRIRGSVTNNNGFWIG